MNAIFFFTQKTAYEMRSSDWSSDVCSSDLGGQYSRPERQGRDVAFADRAQAKDEAAASCGDSRLVGVRHDAGIEQRGCFEAVLMKKVGADELTLRLREALVSCEGILHFRGAPFEYCGEVAVPVVEVSQR